MTGLKRRAGAVGILAFAVSLPIMPPGTAVRMQFAAPLSQDETINRPECPTDEKSSAACRTAGVGSG
jgi:hypothetical protein